MATQERLNRFLARSGVASRRASDRLIQTGRVEVNDIVVTQPGARVDPQTDRVCFDGSAVQAPATHTYVLLNKPPDYLVSRRDPHHSRTVFDLLAGIDARVFPVGRLDLDTQGVLLLTDDGDLSFRLTHPRYGIKKVYRAVVQGRPTREEKQRLREGVMLENGVTAPAQTRFVHPVGVNALIELTLHEGRKRQVKRMCEAIGHPVITLERIAFGGLKVEGLQPGQWRLLTADEVARLKRDVDMV